MMDKFGWQRNDFKLDDFGYFDGHTDTAWMAWQARAALTAAKAGGWLPIETAPKDGTRVLLWRRAIRDQPAPIMADGFWCETCWVWPYILSEPTHWQPLPAPPERAGK